MKTTQDERKPAAVPARATQVGEASPMDWEWVERHVWTERMLEALVKGVKGGVWFSLIDKIQRPQTLIAAWMAVRRNGGGAGSDRQSIKDSPQLNLIERYWKFLRNKCLYSKFCPDFAQFKRAIQRCITFAPYEYGDELESSVIPKSQHLYRLEYNYY
jgi:hypothetical protein